MPWLVRSPTVIGTETTPGEAVRFGSETATSNGEITADVNGELTAAFNGEITADVETGRNAEPEAAPITAMLASNASASAPRAGPFIPAKPDSVLPFEINDCILLRGTL